MKKSLFIYFALLLIFSIATQAQIPVPVLVEISKAEDELRFDKTLEDLIKSPNRQIRKRALLAAGRIGDERAIPAISKILTNLADPEIESMAAFALGEIESIKSADAILKVLSDVKSKAPVRARAVEAAGKIAAANPQAEKSKELGVSIIVNLQTEFENGKTQNKELILLGLTAVLRARPEGGDSITAKFLTSSDARIRADAGNTLTRLRAKNANETLRKMLSSDTDAIARANAARAIGAAEDKDALDILLKVAVTDADSRVRVSSIRAIGSLKQARSAERLIERGNILLEEFVRAKNPRFDNKSEILEIAAALGRILPQTADQNTLDYFFKLRQAGIYDAPEIEIALAQIAPQFALDSLVAQYEDIFSDKWREASAVLQGTAELAKLPAGEQNDKIKSEARILLVRLIAEWLALPDDEKEKTPARLVVPDLLRAFAAFKSPTTSNILRSLLELEKDVLIRATVADILGDQPYSKENFDELEKAFEAALKTDAIYNDAQLSILDALFKLNKKDAVPVLEKARGATDYLVRKKAVELLKDKDLQKEMPSVTASVEDFYNKKFNQILPFKPNSNTKLGQILNTNADYRRAVSRRNGSVRAVLTTEKGAFTINFMPEDAPLTVDNFIKLARQGYFNGLAVHRVVPNFVMQDGDVRGDGNGGPGWSIRCEINMLPYERGAVGMALSGKDTGGSQWFVTHSPQPHLDGGYTVFGKVNESDMKIVDRIVRGDKILSVKIIEGKAPKK